MSTAVVSASAVDVHTDEFATIILVVSPVTSHDIVPTGKYL